MYVTDHSDGRPGLGGTLNRELTIINTLNRTRGELGVNILAIVTRRCLGCRRGQKGEDKA